MFYVYGLYRDIECTDPFYIGKGKGGRVHQHQFDSNVIRNKGKAIATKEALSKFGFIPYRLINEEMDENTAFSLEKELISQIGRIDLGTGPLTNRTNGGDGFSGIIPSDEARKNISKAKKGIKRSAVFCQTMAEHGRRRAQTEEWKTKMATGKALPVSKQTREKMSAARKGRKLRPETIEKMSASMKRHAEAAALRLAERNRARIWTVEMREANGRRKKGVRHTDESKAKMSLQRKGKKLSDSTRAKLSDAALKRWALVRESKK